MVVLSRPCSTGGWYVNMFVAAAYESLAQRLQPSFAL